MEPNTELRRALRAENKIREERRQTDNEAMIAEQTTLVSLEDAGKTEEAEVVRAAAGKAKAKAGAKAAATPGPEGGNGGGAFPPAPPPFQP